MTLLDETGMKILEELNRDARISFRELGDRVHLSVPAVRERVRRMREIGIIEGFSLDVDMEKIGFDIRAMLELSTDYNNPDPYLERIFEDIPEVRCWWSVTGDNDYYVEIVARSVVNLEEILVKLARHGKISTHIVLARRIRSELPF